MNFDTLPLCYLQLNIRFQYFTNDHILLHITFYSVHLRKAGGIYYLSLIMYIVWDTFIAVVHLTEWHNVLLWENAAKWS